MPRRVNATAETRRFGVEIEFVGISQSTMLGVLAGAEIPVQEYGSYRNGRWIVKDDGSVHGPGGGGELVSPPLSGRDGLSQVRTVCRTIFRAGATANQTCGLHVHVDAAGLTGAQMANVIRLYTRYQSVINQIFPLSRHNNRYARAMRPDSLPSGLDRATTRSELQRITTYYNRYQAVNLASYARHGTIEFRQHNGSTNAVKVSSWIRFCLALVEKARTMTPEASLTAPATPARTRGRTPNYADRRALWSLMENGLVDDERTAQRIGHSLQTTRRWIRELQACGVVICDRVIADSSARGSFRASRRISANNRALLNNWLGIVAETNTSVVALPAIINHNTLFEGMPAVLHRHYIRRAAVFNHIWN